MHKLTKIFVFAISSFISTQFIDAHYPNPNDEIINDFPNQALYNQNSPDMREERAFTKKSQNRRDRWEQQNLNMFGLDQDMIKEGLDVNEPHDNKVSHSQQRSYGNQEQLLRGEPDHSGWYSPNSEVGRP